MYRQFVNVVAASLVGVASMLAVEPGQRPSPLPAEIVAEWKKEGARVGWLGRTGVGYLVFHGDDQSMEADVSAFQFKPWQAGVIGRLPVPPRGFGISLSGTKVTDAGLKELAAFRSLQALDLGSTQVTDAGLRELTALQSLQALALGGTRITDAGLWRNARLRGERFPTPSSACRRRRGAVSDDHQGRSSAIPARRL